MKTKMQLPSGSELNNIIKVYNQNGGLGKNLIRKDKLEGRGTETNCVNHT